MKTRNKKQFIGLLILSLIGCKSLSSIQSIRDSQFYDCKIYFTEMHGTCYTYEFTKSNYVLLAQSSVVQRGEIINFKVEEGSYSKKGNDIIIEPRIKMCYNYNTVNNTPQIVSYNSFGVKNEHFYVCKDSLTDTQIRELYFEPRKMILKSIENRLLLIDSQHKFIVYKQSEN